MRVSELKMYVPHLQKTLVTVFRHEALVSRISDEATHVDRRMKMKRFIQMGLLLAIALSTASVSWGQNPPTFQTGDVFVANAGFGDSTAKVLWYRNNGTPVTTLDTGQANTFATGMAFDASGNLYVTLFGANKVVKFDHSGNLQEGTFGSGFNSDPESIRFDSAGNAYVGQADGSHQVLKFSSSGAPLAMFSPAIENRGTDWIDVAGDQTTLYYTSEGNHVKRFNLGTSTQLADLNSTALAGGAAFALRILPSGGVLVADLDRVVRLDNSGNVAQTYFASSIEDGNASPVLFALTLDPDGKSFWTADLGTGTVWKIDISTGAVDVTIPTGFLNSVAGLVVFQEITATNTVNLLFNPSPTPVTQIATIGNPGDPNAQSLALTLQSVDPPVNVSVSFFYEPTDVSTGTQGVGIADGDCENGATEATDFDCRFVPDFVYPPGPNLPAGDKLVPHIIPSHDNLGVWVRVIATLPDGSPAVEGRDYAGPVEWYYAWNTNPPLAAPPPNTDYLAGWNNSNPQLYDRPGENADIAFVANITTFIKNCIPPNCVGKADPGTGGRTKTLNDIVVAAPPNPSGTPARSRPLSQRRAGLLSPT